MVGLALGTIAIDVTIVLVSWVRLRRQKRAQLRAVGGDWQAVGALKTPSRLPEAIAALLPLALAATSARLIRDSQNLIVPALDLADPSKVLHRTPDWLSVFASVRKSSQVSGASTPASANVLTLYQTVDLLAALKSKP
jgi:hypothetical protein